MFQTCANGCLRGPGLKFEHRRNPGGQTGGKRREVDAARARGEMILQPSGIVKMDARQPGGKARHQFACIFFW